MIKGIFDGVDGDLIYKKFMEKRRQLFTSKTVWQSIKYTFVAILTGILNIVFLFVLTEFSGLYYMTSAIIITIFMSFIGFGLHKKITFDGNFKGKFFSQYFKFSAITASVFLLNMALLFGFTEVAGFYYPLSQAIALFIGGFFSFLSGKFYIFPE